MENMGLIRERPPRSICPRCLGTGTEVVSESQKEDPPCPKCFGIGLVVLEVCRGCGRPADFRMGGMVFCGAKECFGKLHKERRLARSYMLYRSSEYEFRNWQGYGGMSNEYMD